MFFSVAMIVLFVRQQPAQRRSDGRIDDRGCAQAALMVRSLVSQQMPFACLAANDFSTPGLCKTLTCPFMRLHFHEEIPLVEQSPPCALMFRSYDHDQTASFHTRGILDGAGLSQLFNDGIHHSTSHLLISHFSPTIGESHLGLVTLFQERFHLSHFNFKVMLIRPRTQLDFL